MKRVVVLAALTVLSTATTASAQEAVAPAPVVVPAEAAVVADPVADAMRIIEVDANTVANLSKAIAMLEANLADTSRTAAVRANGYTDLSRAYQRLGDLKTGKDDKIATYEKGQAAGRKAIEVAGGKHAMGLFWSTANLACVGRTRGVMNSLFMLGDLRKDFTAVIAMNGSLHYPRNTLAEIDHTVPGIAGGSDDRAEKALKEVLARDPHVPSTMMIMARLKRDQGKADEARQWAQRTLDEKAPTLKNDWRKFDVPDAKKLLAELK